MYGWTQRRGCMTAVTGLFVLIGLASVIFGLDDSPYMVVFIILPMAVAGAAWLLAEYLPRRSHLPHLGQLSTRGSIEPALIVPVRSAKVRAALFAQAAFGFMSLALAAFPGPLGQGDTLIVRGFWLFVGGILAIAVVNGIRRWRRQHFYLALTPRGIVEEALAGSSFVPWDVIASVYRSETYGQPQVSLSIRNTDAVEDEGAGAVLRHIEKPMTGHDRSYWVPGMSVTAEWLEKVIQHYLRQPEARREIGRQPPPGMKP